MKVKTCTLSGFLLKPFFSWGREQGGRGQRAGGRGDREQGAGGWGTGEVGVAMLHVRCKF